MKSVLVVHSLSYRHRRTTTDFVMCFDRYTPVDASVTYHNIRRPITPELSALHFDAMFLPYDILALRTSPQWPWAMRRLLQLRSLCDQVFAFPQDDYTFNGVLDQSLAELETEFIYTPIETGLDVVYPVMSQNVTFRTALTGYVDDITVRSRNAYRMPIQDRTVDVGQRVRMLPPWFGRSGTEKGDFAEAFAERASGTKLVIDISTKEQDTFYGDRWYKFLGNCRATIGQKGGASLCDPEGLIMQRVLEYQVHHPEADFDEIEAACFPGLDGRAVMRAISPRLFDAAMLHTVQILIEDDYVGSLEPWTHYIPTDQRLSNFDDIVDSLADLTLLDRIADAAAEVLIESGRFSYRSFVESVFGDVVEGPSSHSAPTSLPGVSDEIQWRLSPELFGAVQRISYQAWATGSVDQLLDLCHRVADLLTDQPYLASYLDADLLTAMSSSIDLNSGLDQIANPIVETLARCFQLAAIQTVRHWFEGIEEMTTEGWELLDWVDTPRVKLDQEVIR